MQLPDDFSDLNEEELQKNSISEIKKGFIHFDKFAHKGTRGHAALFAGSPGMMGAAILTGSAANRSGVGKTTLFVPNDQFSLIHQTIPEVLLKERSVKNIDLQPFNAIGIGPGLGISDTNYMLIDELFKQERPLVLDADALNNIGSHSGLLEKIPQNSILTPHLKEWERLFGYSSDDVDRIHKTINFSSKSGVFILIKGHFSSLVTPQKEVYFNGTGNAGMAKAGSGDVLTGLLTGLLGQGFSMKYAALTALYIHGLSGDIAKKELGEEAMTASDQIRCFSAAFSILHSKMAE